MSDEGKQSRPDHTRLRREDPRPPYLQLAAMLRQEIREGLLAPGSRLPSGPSLAEEFGVAKMTAHQAVRVLKDEGLVVSHQGSGVFVRDKTGSFQIALERTFQSRFVRIDVFGYPSEELEEYLVVQIDGEDGERPISIALRLMVPDLSAWKSIQEDAVTDQTITRAVERTEERRRVDAKYEVRECALTPYLQMCILNEEHSFIELISPDLSHGGFLHQQDALLPTIELGVTESETAARWFSIMWDYSAT